MENKRSRLIILLLSAFFLFVIFNCSRSGGGGAGPIPDVGTVGGSCMEVSKCNAGLICMDSKCTVDEAKNNSFVLDAMGYSTAASGNSDGTYVFTVNSFVDTSAGTLFAKIFKNGDVEWAKKYRGREGHYQNFSYAKQTKDGAYILAGSNRKGGDVPSVYPLVAKLDKNGEIEWQKEFFDAGGGQIYELWEEDNAYLVVGVKYNGGILNLWLSKLDKTGNALWSKLYGNGEFLSVAKSGTDYFVGGGPNMFRIGSDGAVKWHRSIGKSGESSCYITSTRATADEKIMVLCYYTSGDNMDAALLKLNTDGDIEWQKAYGNDKKNFTQHMETTGDGGFIVSGLTLYPGDLPNYGLYLMRLDSGGTIIWQKEYGKSGLFYSTYVKETDNGGYIVASGGKWFFKVKADGTIDQPCPEDLFPVKGNDFVIQNINTESAAIQAEPEANIVDEARNPEISFEKDIAIDKSCPTSS